MKALILAGAPLALTETLRTLAQQADLVVAADAGLHLARSLGLRPNLFVGDMDSVSAEVVADFAGLQTERHSGVKDELDLELALEAAVARGAKELTMLGVLGGRLDQTLAAIFIAADYASRGLRVSLHDRLNHLYPLSGPTTWRQDLEPGRSFSLLGLSGDTRLSLSGAAYPLENELLPFGVGRGVSNQVVESPLEVRLSEGRLLVCIRAFEL